MMNLTIHHPDAVGDPYPIREAADLVDAIRAEAEIIASEAGSDLLASPDQEYRDHLRDSVIANASNRLRTVGDEYRDPFGVRWTLEDVRPLCQDCGRPITLQASGWWTHDGLPDGCWRQSMDGPGQE